MWPIHTVTTTTPINHCVEAYASLHGYLLLYFYPTDETTIKNMQRVVFSRRLIWVLPRISAFSAASHEIEYDAGGIDLKLP